MSGIGETTYLCRSESDDDLSDDMTESEVHETMEGDSTLPLLLFCRMVGDIKMSINHGKVYQV